MSKLAIYKEMAEIISSTKGNLTGDKLTAYEALEQRYLAASQAEEVQKRFEAITQQLETTTEKRAISTSAKSDDVEMRNAFFNYCRTGDASELRNMNTFSTSEGGATIPVSLYNQIHTVVAGLSVVRQLPGINILATSNNVDIPFGGKTTIGYVGQAPSGSYGSLASAFSKTTLKAFKFGGIAKVSEELLNDSGIDFGAFLANRLGTDLAEWEEGEFIAGVGGASAISGLVNATVTNSDVVIPSGSFTAVGTAPLADALVDAFYSLKAGHQTNAAWVVGADLLKTMMKARNGNGELLFDVAGANGVATFLGRPVYQSSGLPAAGAASGAKLGFIADARYITIGDRKNMNLRRLDERYADTGEIGFLINKRSDIALTNADALVKLVKQ